MNAIRDDELILFHYRDGLEPSRIEAIERALSSDATLSQRYAMLKTCLQAAELSPVVDPEPGLEQRLWEGVQAQRRAESQHSNVVSLSPAAKTTRRTRRPVQPIWPWAMAASVLVLLGVGFWAGRLSAPISPADPQPAVATAKPRFGARIYDAYVAEHLDTTQAALLTAVNAEGESLMQGNASLAQALVANNRLYLAAARQQGDTRLVELLQRLEPVLIELANPAQSDDIQARKGLGEFVQRTDLIFQVRATEAGLRARRQQQI